MPKGKMPVIACRCIIVLVCCLLGLVDLCPAQTVGESSGQVWQVGTRRWDVAEEQRFAAWVEETVNEDFFIRHRIAVDCADVPYAIRWIYARHAHLPAAATMEDGRLVGHWSTGWAHLPTHTNWYLDQRFRAVLLYVLASTSTKTLPADTYSIRIAPDSVMAGTVSIVPDCHSGMVGRIVLDGSMFSPVQTWEATLPRKVRKLWQRSYFSTRPDMEAGSGLVRFCWPVSSGGRWRYLAREEHPFYSKEQYGIDFCRGGELFDEAVARRIDPTPYDPTERVKKIMTAIHRYLGERVALVDEGYQRCRRGNCAERSNLWEVYSTPSRDAMIAFEIEHLLKIIKENGLDKEAIRKTMEGIIIPIDLHQKVSLDYVVQNYGWLSSDPNDSIAARWGLRKCDMIRLRMLHCLRGLDFVEQRYRATDSNYADYCRRFHLDDLKWLEEEGRRGGCDDLPPLPPEGL